MTMLVMFACTLVMTGCPDNARQFNYQGGSASNDEEGSTTDLSADDSSRTLDYELIDISGCPTLFGQQDGNGFITSGTDLATKWAQWCPNVAIPQIDFNDDIVVAYYFVTEKGCETVTLKGVHTDGENVIVDIEHEQEVAPEGKICTCTLMLEKKHFIFTTELIGTSPTFNDIKKEIPCANAVPAP